MNILVIVLLTITPLMAQDFTFDEKTGQAVPNYVGQLKEFRGEVFKKKGNNLIAVKKGTRFYKSDSILTRDKSYAKLQIVDDTVINLSENSHLNFSEFKFSDKNNRSGVFDFIKGQIRALVKNKSKADSIQFKTKLATMGIRGTELLINVHQINNKEIAEFALIKGLAHISDKNQNYEIQTNDRIVIVSDPQSDKSVSESRSLSLEEKTYLSDEETFLSLLKASQILQQSPLYALLHASEVKAVDQKSSAPAESTDRSGPKANWEQNLKKLNEKLKEYQKSTHP